MLKESTQILSPSSMRCLASRRINSSGVTGISPAPGMLTVGCARWVLYGLHIPNVLSGTCAPPLDSYTSYMPGSGMSRLSTSCLHCAATTTGQPICKPNSLVERSVSALYHWGCHLCQQPLPLISVEFAYPKAEYHAAVERCFRAPIRYNADRNALIVPSSVFATPVQGGENPYLFKILSQRATSLRSQIAQQQTLSGRVQQLLDKNLSHYGSQARMARELCMSRSTLVRKLANEGVRYSQLLDEARRRCFEQLRGLPASQLAYKLGFMDVSAFYKARRRWE